MTNTTDDLDPLALYAIEQVAEGRVLREIGEDLGITGAAVFARCTKSTELQRRYWLAVESSTAVLEAELLEVARDAAYRDSKAGRVHASTLQWILSKRNPHRYSEQLRLDHQSTDRSMSPTEAIDASKLSDTALAELMAARSK